MFIFLKKNKKNKIKIITKTMEESEMDEYNLNSDGTQQSLMISLINNEKISIIITNKESQQRYINHLSLIQLKRLSKVFDSYKNIKEALALLKNTIESGKILLAQDPKDPSSIEIKFNISGESEDFSPFDIILLLANNSSEEKEKVDEIEELPPTFDYQGNKDVENRYGNIKTNTTEYVKPILKSNYKPPIVQLEYIEPILQVHYPDGSTESKALPPRIKNINGKTPNITEEQFQSIREEMDRNSTIKNFSPIKDYSNYNRSNSVSRETTSMYSTQTMPHSTNNNIMKDEPFNNVVRPLLDNNNTKMLINNIRIESNFNNINTNNFNRTFSDYSSMTHKPFYSGNNSKMESINPTLQNNNLNRTNYFQNSGRTHKMNFNNIIERRPRMINMNPNSKDINRSLSTPSHDNYNTFNPNNAQKIIQPNQTNNSFQTNNFFIQNQMNNNRKFPYDWKTQKPILSTNNQNILNKPNEKIKQSPQDEIPLSRQNKNINNIQSIRPNKSKNQNQNSNIKDKLSLIQRQQQRLQEVQNQLQKLKAQQELLTLQQQKKRQSFQTNNISNNKKNNQNNYPQEFAKVQLINQQIIKQSSEKSGEQIKKVLNQKKNPVRQVETFLNKQKPISQIQQRNPQFEHQTSHDIKPVKTELFSQSQNPPFTSKISAPIPSQTPSLKREISQQQIALAQLASMQNQEDPNCQNMEAITLPNLAQETKEEKEKVQEPLIEPEYKEESEKEEENEENENAGEEKEENQQKLNSGINIEALFITEEGRVIFRNGLLRGIIHKYAEIDDVVSKIQDILLKGVKFNLVYKAFDLDDKAETFHQKCDELEMSLVLIETQKDIRFGGFTRKSWKGNNAKKYDNDSFVFNLDNNKIFEIIPNEPAIGCYPNFGPVFFGCQIRIYNEFFKNGGTTCHKGLNYRTNLDYELNNGEQKYFIKDIEIYGLETIDI